MGSYTLGEMIGKGGMGTVYRAHHQGLDCDVAVKFIHPHLVDDAEAVERFIREARLSAKLRHPNIVLVLDTGMDEAGRPYIVMEYLEGESLRERLRRGPLPEGEAIAIARDVLAGLSKAHQAGIVHRDIKPGNIFVCSDGTVKLVDFGIAKALGGASLTGTGGMVGTPEYMSPEQAEGKPVDGRSDLYSLGIVMYEMLTGGAPFMADSPLVVLRMHSDRQLPALPVSISKACRQFAETLLAKAPAQRPPTASLAADLLAGKTVEPGSQGGRSASDDRASVGRFSAPPQPGAPQRALSNELTRRRFRHWLLRSWLAASTLMYSFMLLTICHSRPLGVLVCVVGLVAFAASTFWAISALWGIRLPWAYVGLLGPLAPLGQMFAVRRHWRRFYLWGLWGALGSVASFLVAISFFVTSIDWVPTFSGMWLVYTLACSEVYGAFYAAVFTLLLRLSGLMSATGDFLPLKMPTAWLETAILPIAALLLSLLSMFLANAVADRSVITIARAHATPLALYDSAGAVGVLGEQVDGDGHEADVWQYRIPNSFVVSNEGSLIIPVHLAHFPILTGSPIQIAVPCGISLLPTGHAMPRILPGFRNRDFSFSWAGESWVLRAVLAPYDPRRRWLAASEDCGVQVDDRHSHVVIARSSGQTVLDEETGRVVAAAVSPDDNWLAVEREMPHGNGLNISILSAKNLAMVQRLSYDGLPNPLFQDGGGTTSGPLALSTDHSLLAVGIGDIYIINVATGDLLTVLETGGDFVQSLTFSDDGRDLCAAIASTANRIGWQVKIWDLSRWRTTN